MPSNLQGNENMYAISLKDNDESVPALWFAMDENCTAPAPYWTKKFSNAKIFEDRGDCSKVALAIASAQIGDEYGACGSRPSLLHIGLLLSEAKVKGTGKIMMFKTHLSEIRQISVSAEIIPYQDFIPTEDPINPAAGRMVRAVCYIDESITGVRLYTKRDFTTVINASIQNRAAIVLHCRQQFELAMKEEIRNNPELQAALARKVLRYHADLLPNYFVPAPPSEIADTPEAVSELQTA